MNEINLNFTIDEEFVNIINSLSTNIKEFMKNCNINAKKANNNSELIGENLVETNSSLKEILDQINLTAQISKNFNINKSNKNNNNDANSSLNNPNTILNLEKNLNEKLNPLIEKLDQMIELRSKLGKNINNIESSCSKFYEEAKLTFKNLKNLHSEKLSEQQKCNNMLNPENADYTKNMEEEKLFPQEEMFNRKLNLNNPRKAIIDSTLDKRYDFCNEAKEEAFLDSLIINKKIKNNSI